MNNKKCVYELCEKDSYAKSYCKSHYDRWRRHGDPSVVIQVKRGKGAKCTMANCENSHLAKGYCRMHYGRVYRNGNPDEKRVRTSDRVCEAVLDGQQCGKPHSGKGYCANHYAQWKRWGDPFGKRPAGLKPSKYKYIHIPGYPGSGKKGRIAEHRWVMSEMLGRGLLTHENVHHKNGDPRDNRPENLELWSTAQPYGQRVEDKVNWAIELLNLYAPDKLKEN